MRPKTSPTPAEEPAGESGSELTPRMRELLAAERIPPQLAGGLEGRIWSRLEAGLGSPPPADGAPAPVNTGLLGKPALLVGGVMAFAALVIGVYFAAADGETAHGVSGPQGAVMELAGASMAADMAREGSARHELGPRESARHEPGPKESARQELGPKESAPQELPAEALGPEALGPETPERAAVSPEEPVSPTGPTPAQKTARAPVGGGDPAAERALLTQARAALRERATDRAFASLAEHRRLYPRGELVEEREALKVHALAGAGRIEEGRRARARFLERFPHSIHAPGLIALGL